MSINANNIINQTKALTAVPRGGTIKPGSLALKDVPVDRNGNITNSFLNQLFKTDKPVDKSLVDASDPSGLSDWARVGVRLIGHDLYDGKLNGDVVLRTLLAPDASNNRDIFAQHGKAQPEEVAKYTDIIRQWGAEDLKDDGKINGSAEKRMLGQLMKRTDNVDITRQLAALPNTSASLNAKELYRKTIDVTTPDGLKAFTQQSGIPAIALENFSFWGHRIMDPKSTSQSIAKDALTNPRSFDFGLANFDASTKKYAQWLASLPPETGKKVMTHNVLALMTQASNSAAQKPRA
jgi:hypothetical protein